MLTRGKVFFEVNVSLKIVYYSLFSFSGFFIAPYTYKIPDMAQNIIYNVHNK